VPEGTKGAIDSLTEPETRFFKTPRHARRWWAPWPCRYRTVLFCLSDMAF
jgi:hypothetical protein